MNIKELSIGNWVEFQNSYYKIRDLYVGGAIHLEDKNGYGLSLTSDYILENIKPIPLTDEILNKNFGILGDPDEDEFDDEPKWCINYNNSLGFELLHHAYKGSGYQISTTFSMNIQYVHQLQNILILLGIDKEIEL